MSTTTPVTTLAAAPAERAAALAAACPGLISLPGEARYDDLRVPWNAAVDQRPAAIAHPTCATDVVRIVRAAVEAGLRFAPQSTGHNAAPLAARGLDDVVVVNLSAMREVRVDPARRVAHVAGGALWSDVVEAAVPHGLTALHGSSPDVGVSGYTLGGGIGWYAREHGLACHTIVAAEVVLPDGRLVRVDDASDPELLWVLRGAGGNVGIVTELTLALQPIETAYAGMLLWDIERAPEVLRAWAPWAATAPEEVTTSFRVMRFPPIEEIPEMLRGRNVVMIDGAVNDTDERAAQLLAPLRALGPELDLFGRVPAVAVMRIHGDPETPTPTVSETAMLTGLDEDAIDAFLSQVGPGVPTSLLVAELRQLGGALARPADGALPGLSGAFLAFGLAMAPVPEMAAAGAADARRFVRALEPWSSGREYLNFCEGPTDAGAAFDAESRARIVAVRRRVDPQGRLVANHTVTSYDEEAWR